MAERVTLRDIASATGLHFTTVGLALRGDRRINRATAERVQAVAAHLGYRRDALLAALSAYRHQRSEAFRGMIGYVFPASFQTMMARNDGYGTTYWAASAAAAELGLKLEPISTAGPGMTPARLRQILDARGIRGMIIAPLAQPGVGFALPWERCSTVAIGYSMREPALHRVAVHHTRGMQMLLRELRALGYRRIGLVLHHESNARTDSNFLGAYLADQETQPLKWRLRPMINDDPTPPAQALERWLRVQRPECVIGTMPETLRSLRALGRRVPDDLGFAILGTRPHSPNIAGIDENWERIGAAAVDLVFALMKNRETGVPQFPRFALVEAKWVADATVRRVG
ncbi:MAG TPA: LacI family DNA-binding transcriptional regulator [Opitutaceae bacterium]